MPLKPGIVVHGQYRILDQLGQGGFGYVYHARDQLLNKPVAIKELIPGLVGSEPVLKRFVAEARATLELTHERIVRTHTLFQENEIHYIVMEYLPGGSLEQRLVDQSQYPVKAALQIAAQVCEGLDYAHGHGVVHCDLKPANILFDAEGNAKVGDFGIAHVSDQMLSRTWQTAAGFVAGTLPYMSPEQANGVRDDPRIDVYALGAVLYRMLTGRTYLDFDTSETPRAHMDNLLMIYNEDPRPPSIHRPGIPESVDAVVELALCKQPDDRFRGAGALRAALLQSLETMPDTGVPDDRAARLHAPPQPSPSADATRARPVVRPPGPRPAIPPSEQRLATGGAAESPAFRTPTPVRVPIEAAPRYASSDRVQLARELAHTRDELKRLSRIEVPAVTAKRNRQAWTAFAILIVAVLIAVSAGSTSSDLGEVCSTVYCVGGLGFVALCAYMLWRWIYYIPNRTVFRPGISQNKPHLVAQRWHQVQDQLESARRRYREVSERLDELDARSGQRRS